MDTPISSAGTLEKEGSEGIRSLRDTDIENGESGKGEDVEAVTEIEKGERAGVGKEVTTVIIEPPPDGGLHAWMQVFYGHLVIMNTWGFINSFGIFQNYYVTVLNHPPSDISWIGSMQVFLLFFIGTFTGRLTDAGYFRPIFIIGAIIGTFGLFMTSLSSSYYQLFLAQGICCGLGNGFLFCPTLATIATYFSSKRSIAIGIIASGNATGGVIFPLMVQQLLPKVGFPWTIRALAFIQLGCLGIASFGMKQRDLPRRKGALIDWESFRDVGYVLFGIGMFFTFLGVYFAFYYIGSFATNIIHLPYSESITLLIILNGVGVVGRLIPSYLADKHLGPLNTLLIFTLISSILSFIWISVYTSTGLYIWAVFYGLSGAAIQGLFPATLSSLTSDVRKTGTRMGMVFTTVSFAVLTGPPVAGALIQRHNGGFLYAQVFAGVVLGVGMVLLGAARVARNRAFKAKL